MNHSNSLTLHTVVNHHLLIVGARLKGIKDKILLFKLTERLTGTINIKYVKTSVKIKSRHEFTAELLKHFTMDRSVVVNRLDEMEPKNALALYGISDSNGIDVAKNKLDFCFVELRNCFHCADDDTRLLLRHESWGAELRKALVYSKNEWHISDYAKR